LSKGIIRGKVGKLGKLGTHVRTSIMHVFEPMAGVTLPHDYTSFVWDELKFIPIIGFATCIEVGSFFFPITYFKATHKKTLFHYPNISNRNYLTPPHQKP
jgi:hypothetical protein